MEAPQALNKNENTNFSLSSISREKLEKIYFKIIEWGIYLALLTPLVYLSGHFFPFVGPKTFFFRIVVDVVFVVYILLAVSNPKYRPRITSLTIAIAVFLAVIALSSFAGLNFERSFFGLFERGTGLLTLLHLFAFYIILTGCFKEKNSWERILTVSIMACLLVSFSVLFFWKGSMAYGGGTLGNSSFFSAYLLFNLFFAVILVVKKTGWWRIAYALALMLFLYALFFNPVAFTKGAVAAFCLGAVIVCFGLLFYFGSKKLKTIFLLLVIILLLALAVAWQFDLTKEKALEFWRSASVQSRRAVWPTFWQAWQERAWLGWGPENLNVPFAKYYEPQIAASTDEWFDRAHNIILDVGVSSGIIGVLSYLLIFGLALRGLLKNFIKKEGGLISSIMIALLAAYFFQNLWVFDTISSYAMFFLSLAFINFLVYPQKEEVSKKTSPLAYSVGVIFIILTSLALFWNLQAVKTSKLIGTGLTGSAEKAIPAFQKAFEVFPSSIYEASIIYLSSRMSELAQAPGRDEALLNQGFELTEEQFKKSISENPLNFRLHLYLGRHHNYFYEFSGNKEKLMLAEEALQRTSDLNPRLQRTYFTLSKTKFLQGEQEKAVELLQEAKELEPRYSMAIWYLIPGYARIGEYELALSELEEIGSLDLACRDARASAMARQAFRQAGQSLDPFIPLYEKNIALHPEEFCFRQQLVSLYLEKGEVVKAKQIVEEFIKLWPDSGAEDLLKQLSEVEDLLKQLEQPEEEP